MALGADVWTADKAEHEHDINILGTPLGRLAYMAHFADARVEKEQQLLVEIEKLPDLQCAWVMLSMSAVPRANHMIRMVPPSQSGTYAQAHDTALWECFCRLCGATGLQDDTLARDIATLPGRLSGLGLRSAARTARAAYWASWATCLPVIAEKNPGFALSVQRHFEIGGGAAALCEAEEVRSVYASQGAEMPSWSAIAEGATPPQPADGLDAMDMDRGWQCHLSSFAENHFRELTVLPRCSPSRRALMLSQGSGAASAWLRAVPSETALRMTSLRFQTAVRRRLRWPIPLSVGICCRGCKLELDPLGDRAASCPTAGRLRLRAGLLERTWARVLREAGGRVRDRVALRDTALPNIDPADGRQIEIVATRLPIAHGKPVAVDATLISPLHADGTPWAKAATTPGVSFDRARKSKCTTYWELVGSNVIELVTAAAEVGGRLSREAYELVDAAAALRASEEPRVLRRQAARAWRARWLTMLSVAVQETVAATMVTEGTRVLDAASGTAPTGVDVWLDEA